jgi:hypothetical protein
VLVFLGYFLALCGLILLAVALFIWKQGDADFYFDASKRSKLVLESVAADTATFSFRLPFRNRGSQQGTVVDVFARPWLPHEQYSAAELTTKVTAASSPRDDGYWEAALFPSDKGDNDVALVYLRFDAHGGDIQAAMDHMVDLPLNIVYQVIGRTDWYMAKVLLEVPLEEFQQAMQTAGTQKVEA